MAEEAKAVRIKMERDYEAGTVTFTFPDGKKQSVALKDLPPDLREKAALYGLGVKIQRSYAGAENPNVAFSTVENQIKMLKEGSWAVARPSAKENKKAAVLDVIKEAKPPLREKVIEMFRTSGTFKKLGISEDEIKNL